MRVLANTVKGAEDIRIVHFVDGAFGIRVQLYHLGHDIGRTTIVDILHEAGLTPGA